MTQSIWIFAACGKACRTVIKTPDKLNAWKPKFEDGRMISSHKGVALSYYQVRYESAMSSIRVRTKGDTSLTRRTTVFDSSETFYYESTHQLEALLMPLVQARIRERH